MTEFHRVLAKGRPILGTCVYALAAALCVLAAANGGCRKSAVSKASPKPSGPLHPCKLAGIDEELLCGKLTVFENRETRIGRTIDLNVVVVPAIDPTPGETPLFDLAGGPGAASTGAASFYANEGKEYRRHRDVVLVDQRGTGNSNALVAPPRARSPQDYLTEMYPVEYVKAMREALEPRADLTQYTTSIAMDDLDEVRAWLGYEQINLFGLSYGTRAALVYLRQHPAHVRSVILMGVVPTDLKMPLHHARAAKRGLDLLLKECAGDTACHQAFPTIEQDWQQALERLGREAARVEYSAPDKSGTVTVEIKRDVFAEKLRNRMYSRESASRIPLIIHQAAQGDFAPFLKDAIPADRSKPDFIADGMYLSVTCAEDVPFIDPNEAATANAGNPFGNYRVEQQMRACSLWPRGKIPADYSEPVTSDIPVLIFSGELDPVTPPERGEEVASHLANSKHVIIPHGAHGLDGLTNVDCLDKVMLDFLAKGNARDLDTTCVERVRPPPFALR